jgi:hypothetical protein
MNVIFVKFFRGIGMLGTFLNTATIGLVWWWGRKEGSW